VFARLRAGRHDAPATAIAVAGVSVAMDGEPVCGDAWGVAHQSDGAIVLIADGLGHGVYASEAARTALHRFDALTYRSSVDSLQAMHDGMRHTRGAAGAIADIRRGARLVKYAGVGNIATAFLQGTSTRQAVSHNGTLGHDVRVIREYAYPWSPDTTFVMHSDGLTSRWSLDGYRGLRQRHAAVIAAVLYRDHARGRDDVTVVVGREAA
jgi:hypothetical protein